MLQKHEMMETQRVEMGEIFPVLLLKLDIYAQEVQLRLQIHVHYAHWEPVQMLEVHLVLFNEEMD